MVGRRSPPLDEAAWLGWAGAGGDGVSEVEGVKNERRKERKKEEREEVTKDEVSGTVWLRTDGLRLAKSVICNANNKQYYCLFIIYYCYSLLGTHYLVLNA